MTGRDGETRRLGCEHGGVMGHEGRCPPTSYTRAGRREAASREHPDRRRNRTLGASQRCCQGRSVNLPKTQHQPAKGRRTQTTRNTGRIQGGSDGGEGCCGLRVCPPPPKLRCNPKPDVMAPSVSGAWAEGGGVNGTRARVTRRQRLAGGLPP